MDGVAIQNKIQKLFGKYKYVLLILALGMLFMAMPEAEDKEEIISLAQTPAAEDPAEKLEEILSQIQGVGKVRVLLTEAMGAETVYQTDRDESGSDTSTSVRTETVIITDSSRAQSGLVKTVTPPVYLGAIIVCQGADSASIRLAIVEAVSNVTGISTDRIAVLKMK